MAHTLLSLQTLRKRLLCPAGVSFLEGKEDIFEDWREKFFNTWKVKKASATRSEGKSPSLHTRLRAHSQINLDCVTAAFAQWALRPGASRVNQPGQRVSGRLGAEILPNVEHIVMLRHDIGTCAVILQVWPFQGWKSGMFDRLNVERIMDALCQTHLNSLFSQ